MMIPGTRPAGNSAAPPKKMDTPLLNFAGVHGARPSRSPLAFAVNK
jgi:hypothetical protein